MKYIVYVKDLMKYTCRFKKKRERERALFVPKNRHEKLTKHADCETDNLNSQGWKCTKLYILNRVQGKKKKKISDNLMLWNCSLANKFIQISQTFSLRFVSSRNRRFHKSWITHNTIMYSYFKDFVKYGLRFSFLLKCELS